MQPVDLATLIAHAEHVERSSGGYHMPVRRQSAKRFRRTLGHILSAIGGLFILTTLIGAACYYATH